MTRGNPSGPQLQRCEHCGRICATRSDPFDPGLLVPKRHRPLNLPGNQPPGMHCPGSLVAAPPVNLGAAILDLLPLTAEEVSRELGFRADRVRSELRVLEAAGLAACSRVERSRHVRVQEWRACSSGPLTEPS